MAHRASDPGSVYGDAVIALNTGGHYLYRSLEPADVPGLRREACLRFYKERFVNAADFTFIFVGSFQEEALLPLLARYLGSLPSTGKPASRFEDRGLRFPDGARTGEVRKGREPRSTTTLTFFADASGSEDDRQRALTTAGWKVSSMGLAWRAKNPVAVDAAKRADVEAFLEELDADDDVQNIFVGMA